VPDRERDELTRKRKSPQARVRPRTGGSRWIGKADGAGKLPEVWRGVLIVLSVGGAICCIWLWCSGHGHLALRVLAGDVILATALLLVV
jgi:hypothetical protein